MAGGLDGLGKTARGPLLLMFRSGGPAGRTSQRAGRTSRKRVLLMLGPAGHQSDQRAGCRAGRLAGLGKTGRGAASAYVQIGWPADRPERRWPGDGRRASWRPDDGQRTGQRAGCQCARQTSRMAGRLAGARTVCWLVGKLAGWLAGCLACKMTCNTHATHMQHTCNIHATRHATRHLFCRC